MFTLTPSSAHATKRGRSARRMRHRSPCRIRAATDSDSAANTMRHAPTAKGAKPPPPAGKSQCFDTGKSPKHVCATSRAACAAPSRGRRAAVAPGADGLSRVVSTARAIRAR